MELLYHKKGIGRVDGELDPGACALPQALSTSGGILREAC